MQLFLPHQNVRDVLEIRRNINVVAAAANQHTPDSVTTRDMKDVNKYTNMFILMQFLGNLSRVGIYGICLANTILFVRDKAALDPKIIVFDMVVLLPIMFATDAARKKLACNLKQTFTKIKMQVYNIEIDSKENQK